MIEADIVEHRNLGRKQRDAAIAFIHLADKYLAAAHARAGKRRIIGDEIFHNAAIHDGGIHVSAGEYPASHSGDR